MNDITTADSTISLLSRYFPHLSERQMAQYAALPALYKEWNSKINVISRKDTDHIAEHHILHSLTIGLFTRFVEGTRIFDVGTGGGFPGIPLAILFPEVRFTLIDSIGKKVRVAQSIADSIALTNVTCLHTRAEDLTDKCDFVVSRAAMPADALMSIVRRLVDPKSANALPNGLVALKGGDLTEELKPFRRISTVEEIARYLPDLPFFETKKIVHIPL